jgi:VanZ family protein
LNSSSRNFRFWTPVLFWLAVIVYESTRLSSNVTGAYLWHILQWLHVPLSAHAFSELHHLLRKAGHVTGYGILCLLAFRAWFHTLGGVVQKSLRPRCAGLALGLTLLTAILDEWHQSFDPSRTSSARDVGFDMAGGIVFLILALFVFRLWREVQITDMKTASA